MRIILLSLITIGLAFAEDIRLPDQARYRTVKDFGAIGDGVHDDTEALRRAIQGTGLLYIPNGTYLISEPLRVPERKGSAPARRILQGQSRAGTIIKLKDGSSAFADPKNPKPVFQISWGIAQAFRNGMRNLTIDVGADNPGAIGCAFMASNQGGMHHVTLTAGAGSGLRGLDLAVGDNGPLLINDLAVSGFKTGIYAKYGQSMTFEHITIKQAEVGIYNQHSLIFARDVTIDASYVGINGSSSSTLALIDARISNAQVAVSPQGGVFIRNLDATSCTAAIAESPEGPIIIEWANQRRHLFEPTLEHSLRLPIVDTPDVPWGDPQAWQAPLALQAKDDLRPDNWLKAYQNIVDSGAHTIYLPMGELRL
ncbi:MAG: glycoside hydrolase family 55 protein, partial [Planctomycetota bacterium]|nr:glycoside hydrolase family 55 protein [Planctomycetota bacterium]